MINGLDEEVYDVVDECVIDNLFLFPRNDAKKISLFLTMFLSSNAKNMIFNIDDFRMKSISIRKVSTLDGEDVYDFRFYNKNRNCTCKYNPIADYIMKDLYQSRLLLICRRLLLDS